jgi:hypothetical protein
MKTLTLVTAIFLALPLASASAEEAKPDPVEVCKAKIHFTYNFDMMNIEREEMDKALSHEAAREKKLERHEKLLDELEDCDDLRDD